MPGHGAVALASLRSAKRATNEPGVLAVGRREVPHVVAVEPHFQSRPVAEVAPEFLPPAEAILREAGLEVEDPGGRESEAVRFDGHERHAATLVVTSLFALRDAGFAEPAEGWSFPSGLRVAADGCQMGAICGAILPRWRPEVAIRGSDQRWLAATY